MSFFCSPCQHQTVSINKTRRVLVQRTIRPFPVFLTPNYSRGFFGTSNFIFPDRGRNKSQVVSKSISIHEVFDRIVVMIEASSCLAVAISFPSFFRRKVFLRSRPPWFPRVRTGSSLFFFFRVFEEEKVTEEWPLMCDPFSGVKRTNEMARIWTGRLFVETHFESARAAPDGNAWIARALRQIFLLWVKFLFLTFLCAIYTSSRG